jgi:hypothetical protein
MKIRLNYFSDVLKDKIHNDGVRTLRRLSYFKGTAYSTACIRCIREISLTVTVILSLRSGT